MQTQFKKTFPLLMTLINVLNHSRWIPPTPWLTINNFFGMELWLEVDNIFVPNIFQYNTQYNTLYWVLFWLYFLQQILYWLLFIYSFWIEILLLILSIFQKEWDIVLHIVCHLNLVFRYCIGYWLILIFEEDIVLVIVCISVRVNILCWILFVF